MKKLVLKQECDVIELSQITKTSIIGGISRTDGKVFINQTPNGQFFSCLKDMDNIGCWVLNSKFEVAKKLIDLSVELFVFDTLKELYQWLAED
jgi:hypothetical protein